MTDITELAQAAEKYRLTLEAHRQNPRNYDALDADGKATAGGEQWLSYAQVGWR